LKENGEVDLSSITIPSLKEKLKNNPFIKTALMYKDIDFECPIMENLNTKAYTLKEKLEQLLEV